MADMKYGFVYLLGHDCMPDVYKVGFTERSPHQRMQELSNSTSVPGAFSMLCYIEVPDPQIVEQRFHKWMENMRITPNREFFKTQNLRWLAGLFQYFGDRLSFTEIDLFDALQECCERNGWEDSTPINPYRPVKSAEEEPPENGAANESTSSESSEAA